MNFNEIKWCSVSHYADPSIDAFFGTSPFKIGTPQQSSITIQDIQKIKECDVVILWGGSDMHPTYYLEEKHHLSQAGSVPSKRDKFEWDVLLQAKQFNKPVVGICLGAQRVWTFNGGQLWQHVKGHNQNHYIQAAVQGSILNIYAAGDHHQAMMFTPQANKIINDHVLLATSNCGTLYETVDSSYQNTAYEIEIAFFTKNKHLCIQGHPEWMAQDADFPRLCRHYIETLL